MNTRMGITPRTEAAVGMQPTQGPTTSSQLTANDRQSPGVGPIPAPPPSPPHSWRKSIAGRGAATDAVHHTYSPGRCGWCRHPRGLGLEGRSSNRVQASLSHLRQRPEDIDRWATRCHRLQCACGRSLPSSERSRDSGVRQRPCRQNSKHRRPSQYSCESQLVGESGGHRTVPSDLVYGATA